MYRTPSSPSSPSMFMQTRLGEGEWTSHDGVKSTNILLLLLLLSEDFSNTKTDACILPLGFKGSHEHTLHHIRLKKGAPPSVQAL